jgi:hypothetical protein
VTENHRPSVRVTEIGEYLRHRSCERRFKLEANHREIARRLPFAERLFNALDPVLQELGRQRENDWEKSLKDAGLSDLTAHSERVADGPPISWSAFAEALSTLAHGQPAYGREIHVVAELGEWLVDGRVDFALLTWSDGLPRLRLVECKASRRDRAYHRVQIALYRLIVRQLLLSDPVSVAGHVIGPDDLECVVARIDETTNESMSIADLDPLSLDTEAADLERLLGPHGALRRIAGTPLDDLAFQLDSKCDGCVFSVHCLPESARQRRLELLGLETSTSRVLRASGVHTIDNLAALDLDGQAAQRIRGQSSFGVSLERLKIEAQARRRTLPGGGDDPDAHDVMPLPRTGQGQLPPHTMSGQRVVRVYLSVSYDYSENRVGALAAHVTTSDHQLHTAWKASAEHSREPDPVVRERWRTTEKGADGRWIYTERPLQGEDLARFKTSEWSGDYNQDTAAERELIQSFLHDLLDKIERVVDGPSAPIHFYVWSRSEMTQLVEACSRASSRLLGALRELLGCRESLEQLIYSCLQDEVDHRFALGWTGRGLSVASSLTWFGRRYHWRRRVAGDTVDLDHEFTQDIFDFKTELDFRPDGTWTTERDPSALHHKFEIRSRFHDSLTAPYWRAYWGTLPDPEKIELPPRVKAAINRYKRAGKSSIFREYLYARVHALRWMEEGVAFKNDEILKPILEIDALRRFTLGVETTAQAAIDFLRLDQHVKTTKWIADHLLPVADRLPSGRTLPVAGVVSDGGKLTATIVVNGYGVTLSSLESRATLAEGSFVRLSPHSGDPQQGQTIGQLTRAGRTCKVDGIDWTTGRVILTPLFNRPGRYLLLSVGAGDSGPLWDFATIDESISDFVAGHVDERLRNGSGGYVYDWLDPEKPHIPAQIPLPGARVSQLEATISSLQIPPMGLHHPEDQVSAIVRGLNARIQLIPGPPGTGKTTTAASAILARIAARHAVGDVILIAAHTHTAVNKLLGRIAETQTAFASHAAAGGIGLPTVRLAKVHASQPDPGQPAPAGIVEFAARPSATKVNSMRSNAVLIIAGTTSAILKLADELSGRAPFKTWSNGFQVPLLIVDEASMMVFPHFLALASIVKQDGQVMLAGDHRQLEPIVAHDWEREDRPPAVLYQPFASAYEAIQRIKGLPGVSDAAILRSPLRYTFRLPPEVLELIAKLYRKDDIELVGGRTVRPVGRESSTTVWQSVWRGDTGLFLIVHNERESKQSNEVEVEIVEQILAAGMPQPPGSIAIVTPHRAQRSLLKTRLEAYIGPVDVIDTVERLQGDERSTVIVSATASDSAAIGKNVEFILDLNRANVAFSRTKDRLIVVCADTLLDYMPVEVEHYDSAMLWKYLRSLCAMELGHATIGKHNVRVMTVLPQRVRELAEPDASTSLGPAS